MMNARSSAERESTVTSSRLRRERKRSQSGCRRVIRNAPQVTPATRLESIQERAGQHGPWRSTPLAFDRWRSNQFNPGRRQDPKMSRRENLLDQLSALDSTFGGMVKPICCAAFKLTTSAIA